MDNNLSREVDFQNIIELGINNTINGRGFSNLTSNREFLCFTRFQCPAQLSGRSEGRSKAKRENLLE